MKRKARAVSIVLIFLAIFVSMYICRYKLTDRLFRIVFTEETCVVIKTVDVALSGNDYGASGSAIGGNRRLLCKSIIGSIL